ncbi:ATP-dependent endonuclease [Microcoleus sp.]|uniref:ATP-dependent nuclease n=1 Tax=Microcoleus sp. TaxID=44472 RepID=UPI00352331EA
MYLSKFQLLNYKSFRDSGLLEFKPGINIIVGANNSGKTALLEALSLNFQNNIHKSLTTFPLPSDVINSYYGYQLSLTVEKERIKPILNELSNSGRFLIAVPDEYKKFAHLLQSLNDFFNNGNIQDIEIQIRFRKSDPIHFDNIPSFFSSSYNKPEENWLKTDSSPSSREYYGIYDINHGMDIDQGKFEETIQYQIFQKYRKTIYRFDAERLNIRSCPVGTCRELKSNASNLAEVLSISQTNPALFNKFNKYVSTVIPGIKWVSVLPSENNTVEIKIWTLDPVTEREDLAFPLSDCGTGVSQVLAILYVVITSQEPRMIIIDEPQSFLHPGAAKKLIGIFKQFPQHQYFIATHSPALITAANPSTIVKLRHEDGETKALVMKSEDLKEQSALLAELGVSLSDVFGADSILWVEGPTEELCFPMILEKIAKKPLRGIQILAVKNTGDLEGKRAEIIFDIYDKLSGGNSLFPPTIGFIFDREGRLDSDIEKLKNRSKKPVEFLERRMYENYLLHPKAIAAIINDDDKERTQPLSAVEVQEWIDKAKQESSYLLKNVKPNQLSESEWLCQVDGAKLLSDIFSNLSETRVAFRKTTHSPKITEWLIDNEPEQLSELEKPLVSLLE